MTDAPSGTEAATPADRTELVVPGRDDFIRVRVGDLEEAGVRAALAWDAPDGTAQAMADDMASALATAHARRVAAWPEEPLLPGPAKVDPLPFDAFPSVLRDHAVSAAESVQISPDVPLVLSLSSLSAATGGKWEAVDMGAWRREWSVLYTVAALLTGERKSSIFETMVAPITEYEADREASVMPKYLAAKDVVEVAEKKLESIKRDVVKGKAESAEVERARMDLEEAREKVPTLPGILVTNATPEALVEWMAKHDDRAAVLSPEGGPLRIADGQYSEGKARLEELKHAWSGETLGAERIGRTTRRVRRPALTLGLTLQPSVFRDLRNVRSFRAEGVFARILFVYPESMVGRRLNSGQAPPMDRSAARRYRDVIHHLLDAQPAGREEDGTPVPHRLRFTDEALGMLFDYQDELEPQKLPGERLAGIRGWAEKLHGQAVRIAVHLELAARVGDRRPLFDAPVPAWAMESAIRICRALTTHALKVFGEMDMDARTSDLQYVLGRAKDLVASPPSDDEGGASLRNLHRMTQNRKSIEGIADLEDLVGSLEERGCLRLVEREHENPEKGGRPLSPGIELHPQIDSDESDETPLQGAQRGGSVTIVTPNHGTREEGRPDPETDPEAFERWCIKHEEDATEAEETDQDHPVEELTR